MKFYYVFYYAYRFNYPDIPYESVKFDHEPTEEEIIQNQPKHPHKKMEIYHVKYRYETYKSY